jgi:hypothetical protein
MLLQLYVSAQQRTVAPTLRLYVQSAGDFVTLYIASMQHSSVAKQLFC